MSQSRQRGAVRKPSAEPKPKREIRWGYYGSMTLLLALVAALVVFGRQPLLETVDRPVAKVAIEGEFRFIKKEVLSERVKPLIDRSFLQLKLAAIKSELEEEAWVARVVLSRNWPDQLTVKVFEEVPIARWDDYGFLSAQGKVVRASDASDLLKDLPKLNGPEESAALVMSSFKRFNQLLSSYDLTVTELSANDRMSWQLKLDNGWLLKLGRDQLVEKVQRLLAVYPRALKDKTAQIAAIDLRYENGFSVSWREPINELAAAPSR